MRRTAATRLGDLGILPHLLKANLNHISEHKTGVSGIYKRATYAKAKREALDRWAGYPLELNMNQLSAFQPVGHMGTSALSAS